jgi:hypothetical protein
MFWRLNWISFSGLMWGVTVSHGSIYMFMVTLTFILMVVDEQNFGKTWVLSLL